MKITADENIPNTDLSVDDSSSNLEKSLVVNGDFEQGGLGWSNPAIQKEENENHYVVNNYNWSIKQDLNLLPNTTYEVSAYTKKGTAIAPARFVFTFLNVKGKRLPQYYDLKYQPNGSDWEEIPHQLIVVPDNAAKTRIYLLTGDKKGFHCFDNIKIIKTDTVG